jgi:hypothetical protein
MPLLFAAIIALCGLPAAAQEDSVVASDTKGAKDPAALEGTPEKNALEWERATLLVVSTGQSSPEKMVALYGGLEAAGLATVETADRAGVDLPERAESFQPTRVDGIRAELLAARGAMRQLQMQAVAEHLEKAFALGAFLQAPQAYSGIFVEMALLRAEMNLATGDQDTAMLDLRLAHRLQPDVSALDPGLHSPTLVERYAQAREENTSAEKAFMAILPRALLDGGSINGENRGDLEVFVDGKKADTPESLTLSAGPHLISLTAPGKEIPRVDQTRIIHLAPGTTTVINAFLPPVGADALRAQAMADLKKAPHQAGGDPARRALLTLTGAQAAVILAGKKNALFLADGRLIFIPELPDDPLAFGRAIARTLSEAGQPPAKVIPEDPRDTDPKGGKGGKKIDGGDESDGFSPLWVGLIAAGATVAVGGVATILAIVFWPEEVPDPPKDRVADVTCCVTGGT